MKTTLSSLASTVLAAAAFFVLPSCKKDSGSGSSTNSMYYLTAAVNGSSWAATMPLDTAGDIVTAILSGTSSGSLGVVVGGHVSGTDTSAFEVVFPMDFALGQPIEFNDSYDAAALYSPNMSAAIYYLTPATGEAGDSVTITGFDQDNQIIEGTFKGTFPAVSGSGSVTVTDGKFKSKYIIDATASPGSGMTIKF